jgi:filamentous hemagglutinin family protein
MKSGHRSIRRSGTRYARHPLSAAVLLAMATTVHAGQPPGATMPWTATVINPGAGASIATVLPPGPLPLAGALLPTGGVIRNGQGSISQAGDVTTIQQNSANLVINWLTFNIGANQTVQFVQPGSRSVALNRVIGPDPSVILGHLTSNGQVFLLNPNGILFGNGASVNVGGLVASTLGLSDTNFLAGRYQFANPGAGAVVNRGAITANGGYVALMGRNVSNQGAISARLGTVALAAGEAITLDVAGDGLLNVSVPRGAMHALVENGGLIQADGGRVLLTAQSAGRLLDTVVNNTGVIQAHTIADHAGTILLLGDMHGGSVNVAGVLDASAPDGGNGGFIETSAAHVNVDAGARISTAAPSGRTGHWLIDPQDFTIGSSAGDNISGSTLSAQLVTNNITITTAGVGTQAGDIIVNDAVSWSASGAPTTLTLNADRNVEINAPITATNGNLVVCCGQDVNVNAAITTTNGSVLLSAGRDINQRGAITVTDGNLMMCAANNVNIAGAITLTRGTNDPTRSLGLPIGMTLRADTDGSGPGIAGGTVVFAPLTPPVTVTAAPVAIYYNPVSYTTATDYSTRFTLTEGAALATYMLVFADGGSREYDGTTATTLTGLIGNPTGVSLLAGPNAAANYATPLVGEGQTITYTGYTLTGTNAGAYALALNCCGPVAAHTTGTIRPASTTPPPTTPPPTTPPPTTPPPTTPPPTTPPPTTPPPTTPPPTTPPPTTPPPTTPPPTTPPPTPIPTPTPSSTPPTYGEVTLGISPSSVAWVSSDSGALLEVTPEKVPENRMTITPEEEEEAPVRDEAPVLAPKPFRN